MIIVWSDEALKTYELIIDDLIEKWNIGIAMRFEEKTNALLERLKEHKKLCPPSKKSNLRKCVIHKNVSLIYKIDKNNIQIITFILNKSEQLF